VKRREFFTLVAGATGWSLTARAEQGEHLHRVGMLVGFDDLT